MGTRKNCETARRRRDCESKHASWKQNQNVTRHAKRMQKKTNKIESHTNTNMRSMGQAQTSWQPTSTTSTTNPQKKTTNSQKRSTDDNNNDKANLLATNKHGKQVTNTSIACIHQHKT